MSRLGRLDTQLRPTLQPSPHLKPVRAGQTTGPQEPQNRNTPAFSAPQPTTFQSACFVVVCLYLVSLYTNDIAFHFFHVKAYLSTVAVFLLPVLFILTGNTLRGFQHPIGKLWLGFAICIALSLPFSVWRGGTFALMEGYYSKAYILYFYLCACVVSLGQLRSLMNLFAVSSFILVFNCLTFGGADQSGRFALQGSLFFGNANELGLQLLLNITFLIAGVMNGTYVKKLVCLIGISTSAYYMLKTGSRGEFLAFLIVAFTTLVFSHRKLVFVAVSIPIICISLFMIPEATLHRLTYIVTGSNAVVANATDLSSLESQMERQHLLYQSIEYSFQYPLFGVGAGQFAVRVAGDTEKRGEHPLWLGTHNSYTQVSSEVGLPGFICYTLAIVLCIRINYIVFRKTALFPELRDNSAIAFSLFLCSLAYAVSTFFFHIAYSGYFPIIGGVSVASYLIAQPLLRQQAQASVLLR